MSFLKYQNESPEFLNNYLKYKRYIEFCAETSVNETYYDLRTLLRYIKLFLYDKDKLKTITKEEFKGMSIKNITTNDLEKMKPHDLENYIIFLCENLENEVVSRNRKLASLKRFYEYLEHNNYISWNPAKFLENARIAKRLPRYLTLSESKKLLSNTIQSDDKNKFRNYAITCLFLNCGLRVSELIGINLSDLKIDKSEKSVKIRGKGNKERILYLDNAVVEAINTYLKIRPNLGKEYKDHDALFISNQNNRISKRMVQTIIKEELEWYGDRVDKFLSVRPGLTGYWASHGRSDVDYPERCDLELYYIDHQSILIDMEIVIKTITGVLTGEGAR